MSLAADMPSWYRPPDGTTGGVLTYRLTLALSGRTREVEFTSADAEIRLADAMGMLHRLGSRIARDCQDQLALAGRPVSCRKGCAACCRYLVPVTVPEAIALAEAVDRQPAEVREVLLFRFRQAARALDRARRETGRSADRPGLLGELSEAYARLDVDCPLLVDELCVHYDHRPLACREHATGQPARQCARPGGVVAMRPPVSLVEAVVAVGRILEPGEPQIIFLSQVMQWWDLHRSRARRTWPAQRVFGLLTGQLALLAARAAEGACPGRAAC